MFGSDICFGVFSGAGSVQAGHAALLLRLGSLIVVEWSHNGSRRIWDQSAPQQKTPSLSDPYYRPVDLRREVGETDTRGLFKIGPQAVFRHYGSVSYSWQGKIADYLRTIRNIRLNPSDYKVRK